MATKVVKCKCESTFQDELYGKHNRLANECKDGKAFRCTVCGKEY